MPNDGASAAAHLRPTLILPESAKAHLQIRTRRLGGQLQARVGRFLNYYLNPLEYTQSSWSCIDLRILLLCLIFIMIY